MTPVFLLISLTFLLVEIDRMRKTVNPGFQDTWPLLERTLLIKEHAGIARFVPMSLHGEYEIANQLKEEQR